MNASMYRDTGAAMRWPSLLVAAGIGLLLGLAAIRFPPLSLLAVVGSIFFLPVLLRRPEIGVLIIVLLSSTLFAEAQIPRVPGLYATDVLLLLLLGWIVVRGLIEPGFRIVVTPSGWPLLAFYGVAFLGSAIALRNSSVSQSDAISEFRYVMYYLTFFVVVNLVRTRRHLLFLVKGIFLLAIFVAMATLLQFFAGDTIQLLPGRVETLSTQGRAFQGIARIIPPGLSLVMVGFTSLTVWFVLGALSINNLFTVAGWALLGLALLLSFYRSLWLGIGLAMFLLFIIVKGADWRRFLQLSRIAMVIAAIGFLLFVVQPEGAAAGLVRASFDRIGSIVSPETITGDAKMSTLRWRDFEYGYALPQVIAHPLLGIGLGAKYRPYLSSIDHAGFDGRGFVHNGHVGIALKTGLLGYFSLLGFVMTAFVRGLRHWRTIADRRLRASVLGFTLIMAGILAGAVAEPLLLQWQWVVVIGIALGISESILQGVESPSVSVTGQERLPMLARPQCTIRSAE